ncbi:MAG: hypothetical protein AMXMBFR53_02120 [Gemmatimonadota bacterium]
MTGIELAWSAGVAGATVGLVALMEYLFRNRAAAFHHALWVAGLAPLAAAPVAFALVGLGEAGGDLAPAGGATLSWTAAPVATGDASMGWTLAWAVPCAVLLLRALAGWYLAERLARRARRLRAPEWRSDALAAARRLGLRTVPRLAVSPEIPGPAVVGAFRPTLLLPPASVHAPPRTRRAIVEHEFAHVARRDLLLTRLAALVRALHWYNPLVWWALRRLDLTAECACDDAVLRGGLSPRQYVRVLVDAAHPPLASPVLAGTGFGTAPIVKRVAALASPRRSRRALASRERGLVALLTAAALAPLVAGCVMASSMWGERTVHLGPNSAYTFTPEAREATRFRLTSPAP